MQVAVMQCRLSEGGRVCNSGHLTGPLVARRQAQQPHTGEGVRGRTTRVPRLRGRDARIRRA